MIPRHQLAVAPRVSPGSMLNAAVALAAPSSAITSTAAELHRLFDATQSVLTDSGTSALVLALRIAVGEGGIVALPGYGCSDFASAVRYAGVRVRLYDIDPRTMSPDPSSLEQTLRRGAAAVVVAHYYGYPVDVAAVKDITAGFGAPVIEDAAQAAGGAIDGRRLGTFGDLSVLSFGRGKGLFGGNGGALLASSPPWNARLRELPRFRARRGIRDLAGAAVQWALGRPSVYTLPASLPYLHLGEMVYHAAGEPCALSGAAARLVRASIADEPLACARRRASAKILRIMVEQYSSTLVAVAPLSHAEPGFLRFAVLDRSGHHAEQPRLGVMRGYPRTLHEQPELAPVLMPGEPPTPGATELRETLFTLPTHDRLEERDFIALQRWIAEPDAPYRHMGVDPVQRRHVPRGAKPVRDPRISIPR